MIFKSLPVDAPLRITSKFGPRDTGIKGASTNHKGIDLGRDKAKAETAILSVADGVVIYNGWTRYRGWYVVVKHDDKYRTLYQHLKSQCPVTLGTRVSAGQKLGIMGNSSDTTVLKISVHLHFELWENGNPIDPEYYLKNVEEDMTEAETKNLIKAANSGKDTKVSPWAKESWDKATKLGIVDGTAPGGIATREMLVTIMDRLGMF